MNGERPMRAVVAERGQVTIPMALRQMLGIKKGTVLNFEINGGVLSAAKAEQTDNIRQVYGCLGKLSTDSVMKQLRGEE